MAYKQTYNPCDDCQYSYSKNGQESNMCKVCEFRQLLDKPTADVAPKSEVANILDELMKQAGEIAECYKKEADGTSCYELARIEYRGTQIGALLVQYKISELKKKYTEERE